ncbi:MAG: hypothetical protein DRJ42_15450 [Deltaproteobacteria bacterium]|nr:MAG: hypothetical protein DRJ42_15450 [Deltaproteobacteria bacterium]
MSCCPHQTTCSLFPMFSLKSSLKTWQIRYCDSDFKVCHRYAMTERGQAPPDNLLPSGKHLPVLAR